MKLAYSPSYVPELRPPLAVAGAAASTALPFSYRLPHNPFKLKLSNPCGNCCVCFSHEDEYLEPDLGFDGDKQPQEPEKFGYLDSESEEDGYEDVNSDGLAIHITKLGKRSRRVESSIVINASLQTIWGILTDYERLADFIPGLAVSRLLQKRDNYARLFQIGQQNLALGIKFNARAVLDCYEKDLEILSFGQRRDIEFKMVEGDFETFEGKWSIEEYYGERCRERCEASQVLDLLKGQGFHTILSYVLEVEPKMWLPVRLVEGRLCREIKTNLSCVRQEAHMRQPSAFSY